MNKSYLLFVSFEMKMIYLLFFSCNANKKHDKEVSIAMHVYKIYIVFKK